VGRPVGGTPRAVWPQLHFDAASLLTIEDDGVRARVIAGRLLGLAIAVPVTSGHVFSHDGPVPINPTPTVDDNSAAAANKQRWRLPGFGRD
jgi:hypothetical protein